MLCILEQEFKFKSDEKEETFDKAEKVVTKYEGEDPKTFK